jgi:transglutaminase-like putative cysteine protease
MDQLIDPNAVDETPSWFWRSLQGLERWARPMWGWGVLVACMLLAMLPAVSLRANHWLALGNFQSALETAGPLAVATVWVLWGWRRPERRYSLWMTISLTILIGALVVSELLLGWIPGPRAIRQTALSGEWTQLVTNSTATWVRAFTRFVLWRQGVAAGGAAQDNLVFATFGSAVLWLVGALTAFLARGVRQGFAAGAPTLWLLGIMLLYSSSGRYLLLVALALTLALHILLEQGVLTQRWKLLRLDYSPGLLLDRLLAVLSAAAVILTLAAVMPNLYIQPLVDRYYMLIAPAQLATEQFGERLFPELHGTSRLRGGGGGGMPNEFLLQGGPDLGSARVMRVRTDEAPIYQLPYDEMAAPPGHYMRGRTLTVYDGRSWSNPNTLTYVDVAANQRWEGANTWGRKQVVQSVILEMNASTLFAAPEPVETSAEVRVETRGPDDVVTLQASEASYTAISMVPALDEAMLRSLPGWTLPGEAASDGKPQLPEEMAIHLALPETVTDRTRALAQQLVEGRETEYDKALAIEQYLRQYTYDLDVPQPPAEVRDVADYFLFELQRGYCDYYATAFVVLARLAGLPTRFATGFAPGQWDPVDGVFAISESDAHSWPEVYFPEAGWIPFEPTAGRAQLTRIALPQANPFSAPPPIVAATTSKETGQSRNWQLLVWLIPLVGAVWLIVLGWRWWWRRREDPWQAVIQWGNRIGRPIGTGETVLEYGEGLAGFVLGRQSTRPDAGRIAAREIQAVSEEVNRLRYGRADERLVAKEALAAHWERLRSYLPLVRIR